MLVIAASTLAASLLAGCVAGRETIANPAPLQVSFAWSAADGCTPRSPQINVAGLPHAATRLAVAMTDLNVPNFPHGGGEVAAAAGGVIAPGALRSYTGPCPPGRSHQYRIDVEAVDAQNRVIALGSATRSFPP